MDVRLPVRTLRIGEGVLTRYGAGNTRAVQNTLDILAKSFELTISEGLQGSLARIKAAPKAEAEAMSKKILSDIEDGIALRKPKNKQSEKRRKTEDEHTIPPIPMKSVLSSFTLSNPQRQPQEEAITPIMFGPKRGTKRFCMRKRFHRSMWLDVTTFAGMSTPTKTDIGLSRHRQICIRRSISQVSISLCRSTSASVPGSWRCNAVRRVRPTDRGSHRCGADGNRRQNPTIWRKRLKTSKPWG